MQNKPGPKVVMGDNLSSHFSDEVLKLCKQHNIRFVCLPPNSTHITQPLDVSFFGPMKRIWRRVLANWRLTASGMRFKTLRKCDFPRLLKLLMTEVSITGAQNLISGFEKCGIHPINVEKILERLPGYKKDSSSSVGASFRDFIAETRRAVVGDGKPVPPKRKQRKEESGARQKCMR